jgi:hypothetical protein
MIDMQDFEKILKQQEESSKKFPEMKTEGPTPDAEKTPHPEPEEETEEGD